MIRRGEVAGGHVRRAEEEDLGLDPDFGGEETQDFRRGSIYRHRGS